MASSKDFYKTLGVSEKASADEIQEVEDAVTSILVADQSRAFVDIVTDGMARWSGPHSHLATHLDGTEKGGLQRWFDTNFYDRRLRIVGELKRRGPMFVRDYEIAEDTAQKPLKPVLPGPVTVARMAEDEIYGSPDKLAEELAAMPPLAVAGVLRCVVGAGAAPLEEALDVEREAVRACSGTRDQIEGMTAFLEKRRPVFTGE